MHLEVGTYFVTYTLRSRYDSYSDTNYAKNHSECIVNIIYILRFVYNAFEPIELPKLETYPYQTPIKKKFVKLFCRWEKSTSPCR